MKSISKRVRSLRTDTEMRCRAHMPLSLGMPCSFRNLGRYWAHTRGVLTVCWCDKIITEQRITQPLKLVPRAGSDLVSGVEEDATTVMGNAELETLKLLEWRDVCKQVASFCCTPLAAQQAWNGSLPIGKTMEESELLLEQTREAGKLDVNFGKIYDIRRAVAAALDGSILHPMLLAGIVTTLRSASDIENAINNLHVSGIEVPSLREVSKGICGGLGELQAAITECISVTDGRLRNEASPRLEEIRQSKQENLAQLRKRADEWGRAMYASGAAERPQVVIRRDRLCIPIKAGRQSDLPRGSLALATSGSGGTVYMEPEPLISLNNNDATLTAAEQEEEERILTLLSKRIADHSNQISTVLSAIATLDLAFARARHAAWMGSERPRLVSIKEESSLHSLMHVEAAVHPLLVERSRPPLPVPPLPEVGLPAGQHQIENMVGIELIPELMRDSDPLQINPSNPSQISTRASNRPRLNRRGGKKGSTDQAVACNESIESAAAAPTPIDLTIPPSVSVVAVTGPNTGGKTASLKTLGLIVLMVKAGLFVPTSAKTGDNRPVVAWFDKVLADIGDGQSLQQSLSTFSSHIKRIRELMLEASPSSLLLLDELGSGTNPLEGAALACALLEYFSKSRAALTYATSHHAEVKEMADRLPNFVNASVEFNYSTLKPTFKLVWGSAGDSNALRVAQGLGFDPKVIKEAHDIADQLRTGSLSTSSWATNLQSSLQQQLEEALVSIVDSAKRKDEAERYRMKAVEELKAAESQLELLSSKNFQAERTTCLETARSKVKKIVRAVYNDNKSIKEAEADIRRIEKELLLTADKTAELGMSLEKRRTSSVEDQSWAPAVGDWVSISKMRGTVGQITKLHGNEKVTVRAGALTIQLQWGEYSLADKPTQTSSNSTKYRSSSFSASASAKGRKYKDTEGVGDESRQERNARGGVAVQTTRNTIDVRGFTTASAEAEVEAALKSAERGAVLFMVHGIGTGKVREAVLQCLKQNKSVERWEEEEGSKGGCTVVYMRQSE